MGTGLNKVGPPTVPQRSGAPMLRVPLPFAQGSIRIKLLEMLNCGLTAFMA